MCGGIGESGEVRKSVEWDIDANVPLYTRDYLKLERGSEDALGGLTHRERREVKNIIRQELIEYGLIPDSSGFMHAPGGD